MRRVAVTGLGIVSSIGNDKDEVLQSLREGRSGIEYCEEYAERGFRSHVHGSVNIEVEEHIDRKLLVITPGIRPVDNKPVEDQKRVVTVEKAFQNGADYIVVGRPIRDAESPRAAAESIQATIAAQFREGHAG